jgi:XTP/dITP diphosphohydrolase
MKTGKMTKIYYVTGNRSKFLEASSILKSEKMKLVQKNIELTEPQTHDQRKIVLEKARQAYEKMRKPVIVDDVALYFNAYPSFPGTFTKFLFPVLGYDGIRRLLKGQTKSAFFEILVCYKDRKVCKIFSGAWKGKILDNSSSKINPDWPYNSIFVPNGYSMPLSEIPNEERFRKSHRWKAFQKLMRYLEAKK